MKTMTCKQMGGMCDESITATDKDDMLAKGMQHIEVAHPDMAANIKAMPKDDPKMVEWEQKFNADYAALPEN